MTKHITTRKLVRISVFIALLSITSKIAVPLGSLPASFTLQIIIVLLCGLLLDPSSCFMCLFGYLALGLLGLPVFSLGGGFAYIFQPSFGYLLGFLIAAPFLSILCTRLSQNYATQKTLCYCILSLFIIHLMGILYFIAIGKIVLQLSNPGKVAMNMLFIYLPLDILKSFISISLSIQIRKTIPAVFH